MRFEIVAGSPRTDSVSIRIAKYLQKYLSQHYSKHHIGLIDVREWKLGFLENVFTSVENTPTEYKPLAERMFAAEAFILITPEYNGSYSSELKNLFDHFPKQSHKVFGLCTTSVGVLGGARSTQSLLLLIPALFGVASPHLLIVPQMDKKFNEDYELIDASFEKQIKTFVSEFVWLAEKLEKPSIPY